MVEKSARGPGVAEASREWTVDTDFVAPTHPGEMLLEEFIRPHGLTPIRTAARLGVPRTRIERLVAGETRVSADTALRLERLFGTSAEFWLGLQAKYDLVQARRRDDPALRAIEPLVN
jgi:antitoxin HigA-1